MNFNQLKTEIKNTSLHKPVFIYIGVGTAAYTKITPENYQQFPPFLQDMQNKIPTLTIFLVLIDPMLEMPLHVVLDYKLEDKVGDGVHYKNANESLHAFVYRCSVCTDTDTDMDNTNCQEKHNITTQLHDLNNFAIGNNISLLYHDFTGRDVCVLAEYFDNDNINYLDQLVYAMSARENHGCSFDLTHKNTYFPFRIEHPTNEHHAVKRRPIVKLFNYYKFFVNETTTMSNTTMNAAINAELNLFPAEMHYLAEIQKKQIIHMIMYKFKNVYLPMLRHVRKAIQTDGKEELNIMYAMYELPKMYRQMFTDLYNEKEYDLLYELMFNYCVSKINVFVQLTTMDMSGEEILSFITLDQDPYKWHNNVNTVLCNSLL